MALTVWKVPTYDPDRLADAQEAVRAKYPGAYSSQWGEGKRRFLCEVICGGKVLGEGRNHLDAWEAAAGALSPSAPAEKMGGS